MAVTFPDFPERSGLFRELRGELMKTIDFSSAPRFLLALSGGLDSVFLFYFLVWLRAREGFELSAAHFNHHLRPSEDAEDAAFVRKLCRDCAVPLQEGEADVLELARKRRKGIEEAARFARYRFFDACLAKTAEDNPAYLCLAHQENDQVETLLLNLSRGAGLSGLAGMRRLEGRRLRPLLGLSRAKMQAFMEERGLSWREDSSNAENKYLRNRLRHELLPLWQDICGGDLHSCLARSAHNLGGEEERAELEAEQQLEKISQGEYLRCRDLAALPAASAYRVLKLWLARELDFRGLSERQFRSLWRLLQSGREGRVEIGMSSALVAASPLLRIEGRKGVCSGKDLPSLL